MKMYCMNCGAIKDEAAASAPVIYCLCGFAWWSSNPDFSRSIRNGSMPAPTEADALRAEVAALKAELTELRALRDRLVAFKPALTELDDVYLLAFAHGYKSKWPEDADVLSEIIARAQELAG